MQSFLTMDIIQILLSLLCLISPLPSSSYPAPKRQSFSLGICPSGKAFPTDIHSQDSIYPSPASFGSCFCNFLHEPSMANLSKTANHTPPQLPILPVPLPSVIFCLAFTVYLLILFMVYLPSWNVSFMWEVLLFIPSLVSNTFLACLSSVE